MTANDLRAKRSAAGIPGYVVCHLVGVSRTKLSDIERGYVTASPEDLNRIEGAINKVLTAKQRIADLAAEAGLRLAGIRL